MHLLHWLGLLAVVLLLAAQGVPAATEDLGSGFRHHGVATPVSNHRGIVATVDGAGRDVVLCWLFDCRGGYALLMVDAETGKSESFPMPFPPGGDCPYASILSSGNKFYTHFNSYFTEFDPVQRKFTFTSKTAPQMAMGMTEDDNGVIWSVSYPQSGFVSFNPKTREFKDYGQVYKQNWAQYQRYVAADDAGWVYAGVGSTNSQILAFDPTTGKAKPLLAENERGHGAATVTRDRNGKVYGYCGTAHKRWLELYKGERRDLTEAPKIDRKPIITESQSLFYRQFPSGRTLEEFDTVERTMAVRDPKTKQTTTRKFDYASEGAHIMGICAAPDGTLCGGTAFPMRAFAYDPREDTWTNRAAYGQWNTVARQGDCFFVGGYGGGFLLQWEPAAPWVPTVKGKPGNPQYLTEVTPTIHRPHDLLPLPDSRTVVLAGTPGYGYTGGGLLFWDRETKQQVVLKHEDLIPEHSTNALAVARHGKLLGGTTIGAGTGGEVKATVAELYLLDLATRKIEWHAPVLPGARSYTDLAPGPYSLVFGVADCSRFFVFDTRKREIVYQRDLKQEFGPTNNQQGPRVFVKTPKGLYMLFGRGIASLNRRTFEIKLVAESPVSIGPGGDYYDGRIYFGSGSRMYSWQVK